MLKSYHAMLMKTCGGSEIHRISANARGTYLSGWPLIRGTPPTPQAVPGRFAVSAYHPPADAMTQLISNRDDTPQAADDRLRALKDAICQIEARAPRAPRPLAPRRRGGFYGEKVASLPLADFLEFDQEVISCDAPYLVFHITTGEGTGEWDANAPGSLYVGFTSVGIRRALAAIRASDNPLGALLRTWPPALFRALDWRIDVRRADTRKDAVFHRHATGLRWQPSLNRRVFDLFPDAL